MFGATKLIGATLGLRDYNTKVSEAIVIIKVLRKLTGFNMPKTKMIV
ncbi:hypothetical protein BTN50_0768 [Candidatus Enterovibrio altilux]|uniref:Mobile element protein n=1 Tax=Candidatus Enterovibrio altilux TaxID=1927128 RepID=A0A291B8G2_9GAMM|nr:hypothetical protein BTN50_0768 [Candidatus Enterovibrio luxaltus]